MSRPLLLHCLHGFFGRPDTWTSALPAGSKFVAHDLLEMGAGARRLSFAEMGARLNAIAREDLDHVHVLVGYSMGGRIALQALLSDPSLWRAAVIIAANPGVPADERAARLAHDRAISARFATAPWAELLATWDAQPVFGGRKPTQVRDEKSYNRSALVYALEAWSLGRQEDFRPALRGCRVPTLWLSGAEDTKYSVLARECASRSPAFQFASLEGAAHRAPWEAPVAFKNSVSRFLSELKKEKESSR